MDLLPSAEESRLASVSFGRGEGHQRRFPHQTVSDCNVSGMVFEHFQVLGRARREVWQRVRRVPTRVQNNHECSGVGPAKEG